MEIATTPEFLPEIIEGIRVLIDRCISDDRQRSQLIGVTTGGRSEQARQEPSFGSRHQFPKNPASQPAGSERMYLQPRGARRLEVSETADADQTKFPSEEPKRSIAYPVRTTNLGCPR